ncbi:MAG: hypothetical protein AB2692_18395, partial [Candidatus Thiodiazotropha sp.]
MTAYTPRTCKPIESESLKQFDSVNDYVPLLTPAQVEKIINRINEGKKNPIAYDKVFFLQNELTI